MGRGGTVVSRHCFPLPAIGYGARSALLGGSLEVQSERRSGCLEGDGHGVPIAVSREFVGEKSVGLGGVRDRDFYSPGALAIFPPAMPGTGRRARRLPSRR